MIPSKQSRSDVLLVLKVPPPYGGGELMHRLTVEAFAGRFSLLIFRRRAQSKASQGRLRPSNLFFGFYWMARLFCRTFRQRPRAVFLWLPKDWSAFLRTSAAVRLLDKLGVRVIGDLHGMGFAFLTSPLKRRLYVRLIRHYAAVRVLGEGIAAELRRSGFTNRIAVIDNGIAVPAAVLQAPVERSLRPLQLLYLGAVSPAKGFDRIVDLLPLLDRSAIDWRLTVAGEWTDELFRRTTMSRISASGAGERVRFVGLQLDDAKWKLLMQSDLLLHFSRWDGQPLTLIEAMAAGVPAVAYAAGAVPEMIRDGENGWLVDSPEEAAALLKRLAEEPERRQAAALNARRTFLERFTAERYLENLERFILETAYAADLSVSKNR